MLINFNISAKKKINNEDIIVAKENGSFELKSKDEFLQSLIDLITKQNKEITSMKTLIHKHNTNIAYLMKKLNDE